MSTPNNSLPKLEVHMFACLEDNYGFLIHDPLSGFTACVDTPEVEPTLRALAEKGWELSHILNTHHHFDHAGGNLELKEKTDCIIIGARKDAQRIPGIDIQMGNGDIYLFGQHEMTILETPGHTVGHVIYYFADSAIAFVGDTLFSMGCGRLFEGTAEQMWESLQVLSELPGCTKVYAAHEYTESNARFAITIEPNNRDLVNRIAEIKRLRANKKPTLPTSIAIEKLTNPFLRPDSADIRQTIGMPNASDEEVFAEIRARKDKF